MMYAELQKTGQGAVKKVSTGSRRKRQMVNDNSAQVNCPTVVDGTVLRGKARLDALLKEATEQVAKQEEEKRQDRLEHRIFGYNVFTIFGTPRGGV